MLDTPNETGDSSSTGSAATSPQVSLPKGGGAIRGIGEKFAANPVTGTGSLTVPIATSLGRSGFAPQLSLSYDSGSGNGPFGLGWSLSLPKITRRTDKGLPRYQDADESDIFILSGATLSVFLVVSLISPFTRSTLLQRSVAISASLCPVYRPKRTMPFHSGSATSSTTRSSSRVNDRFFPDVVLCCALLTDAAGSSAITSSSLALLNHLDRRCTSIAWSESSLTKSPFQYHCKPVGSNGSNRPCRAGKGMGPCALTLREEVSRTVSDPNEEIIALCAALIASEGRLPYRVCGLP
jgi:Salmonella virulence plasmid 65kDa B protein